MYKLVKSPYDGVVRTVTLQVGDMLYSIPLTDIANSDYQAYLKWVEEGNIPLPADK